MAVAPEIMKRDSWVPDDLALRILLYKPKTQFGALVRDVCKTLQDREQAAELLERITSIVVCESSLFIKIFRHPESLFWAGSLIEDYGLVRQKLVTDLGVAFMVDAFQNIVELENMKYHAYGTSSTAEGQTQTALVAELTTQYATDNTRPTGSTTEQSAAIYKTVATLSPDITVTIEEHGIFDQAANSGGVLLDRSLTGTKALTASLDSLQTDYRFTIAAGG